MRCPWGKRLGRVDRRPDRRLAGEEPLLVEQGCERDARQTGATPLEERPAIEHPAAGMRECVAHGSHQ